MLVRSKELNRNDDKIEIVTKRYEIFEKETLEIINKLSGDVPLISVNGNEKIHKIHNKLANRLKFLL